MATTALRIRPYRPADRTDRDDVYDVCVRTGDAGADATGQFSTDDLLPDIYAGPYLSLEPQLAFVLDNGARVVGYVLGTADTARFVQRWRQEWVPAMADKYASLARTPAAPSTTLEQELLALLLGPERMLRPELAGYPAHLHIDLLPEAQGQGHGRTLIETLFAALTVAGARGVHLGVAARNLPAQAFYDRLGFRPIAVPGAQAEGTVYLGRPLPAQVPPPLSPAAGR